MRNVKIINPDWRFSLTAPSVPSSFPEEWDKIDLPYTWNGDDGQDGGNDYLRTKGFFAKKLGREELTENEVCYIQLDGVNSSAEVFFNGKKLCVHHGGYSTFRVKIDRDLIRDENLLVITADNTPNDFVYPQVADFTFYGGIYRDVSIISAGEYRFDLDSFGSDGIKVTPKVNGKDAEVTVESFVTAPSDDYEIAYNITANGEAVLSAAAEKGQKTVLTIKNAHLWDGVKDPFLYTLTATLTRNGEALDEVKVRFGCRSYIIDPQKGFILNGRSYPLRGVARHQDRPHIGNALTPEHHREDIGLICEMGANTVRLAHYQHSRVFYDLCDEKGLIVWAEIPYISRHMANGTENTKTQMTELIYQNYNHPCIAVWGLSNEITMNGESEPSMVANHKMLNDLAHSLDPSRPTTAAILSMCPPECEYVKIPDVISYNHYFGWYGGSVEMNGDWFDRFHKKFPDRAVGLSEYGAEALNWHTSTPEQGDYTEEYQAYYHEEMIKQIAVRPYIWATHVWNMFDFAADARSEGGENGMNHKGLVSFDRKYKKDAFYAYKAWLSDEPFVHICSKRYIDRVEDTVTVRVYTNLDEVELFANGVSIGKQTRGEFPFYTFKVPNSGETVITAKAGSCTDESVIRKVSEFNESYRMKEEGAVINWFEITTPPGKLSVNNTIGDILKTARGKIVLIQTALSVVKKMKKGGGSTGGMGDMAKGMKINKSLIEMGKGFTVKRVCMMAGGLFTKEQILALNRKLNKISRK